MTIKLIALDIDGTTLMSDGSLSQRNREPRSFGPPKAESMW